MEDSSTGVTAVKFGMPR